VKLLPVPLLAVVAGVAVAGCGGTKHTASSASTPTTTPATTAGTATTGAGALQAEARSAATGDIPDNQVFVVFSDPAAGYSMKYPEGWAQSGGGRNVIIRDKNNIIRVVVRNGGATAGSVRRELATLPSAHVDSSPQPHALPSGPAVKVVYSTQSAPNPVTGKRVKLLVDRYYLPHPGKVAIVDLGTPQGVDNVDAYRLMIESFRWR
jgi:hypothetical protein